MKLSLLTQSKGPLFNVLLLVAFMIGCSASGLAQIGGIDTDPGDRGTGGKNVIQGAIFLPGGQKLDRRVKVKLTGIAAAEQFQMSDDSGAFTFRRLQGGRYVVSVDAGKEFEIATENADIIEPAQRRGSTGTTISIYITLQPKRTSSGITGTVDAKSANIPEAARELYRQALESAKLGEPKKAIEQLDQALEIYPNFMAALNQLGVQYMELKNWSKAGEVLRKAIGIAPEAFPPRLNHGIVLTQLKDYKGAIAELSLAIQKDATSGPAHFYLGRALVSVGNYDAAETALRQTITLASEEAVEAHRYLGAVYIEKRDSARAADELETYLKLAPKAKDADRIRAIVKDLRSQASSTTK